MRLPGRLARATLIAAALTMPSAAPAQVPLKMYVAASTKEVVETIAQRFERETGVAVEISPGPSSKLAKQIVEGAPADLFLSADQANADYLSQRHLVAKRRNLLANRLVVVIPNDRQLAITRLEDLAKDDVRELALALEKVPAGEYARAALRKAGVWERVAPKVVGGEDVRATLAFVERGASAGIVYFTDTVGNSKVRVAMAIDPTLHPPIEYPLVLIEKPRMNPAASRFYDYLLSPPAAAIFEAAKFHPLIKPRE